MRRRLARNVDYTKKILHQRQFPVASTPAPIISWTPKTSDQAELLKKRLMALEVFPSLIRYPGGPPNGYFRFVLSSQHTCGQLNALLEGLSLICGFYRNLSAE